MGYSRPRGPSFARVLAAASIVAVLVIILLTAASPASAATQATVRDAADAGSPLTATIRRDDHGIPNIIGDNFADIGFGYGYALAQDNICELAETYVTVRGERSQYSGDGVQGSFGPDGSYLQRGNGFSANNVNSDFFYQRIIDDHTVEKLLAQPPPDGAANEIKPAAGFEPRMFAKDM